MPTPAKQQEIDELNSVFKRAKGVVMTRYQGITAPALGVLRAHMHQRSLEFRVVKNSLARKAAKNTGMEALDAHFKGPVSLIMSFNDVVAPAKALRDYAKTKPEVEPEVLVGMVDGKKVTPQEVKVLSELPSKEVLLAQMLSTFQGPTTQFVGVFHALLRKLVGTLAAVQEKKAKSG
jgi:large subunit ribosomal protein L10